jgi:hypothetical protein
VDKRSQGGATPPLHGILGVVYIKEAWNRLPVFSRLPGRINGHVVEKNLSIFLNLSRNRITNTFSCLWHFLDGFVLQQLIVLAGMA